ncbi:MAG: radical SAM-associated putative lipoprotein [Treponema sp.]|jgi:putative lipoprotein (rSAM/lipoprotein system)|nr:radical SAM-associated putative lipoprotein [Treponema sp.]
MKRLSDKNRRILRMVYQGLGAAAVSLLFQACYGMPLDDYEETDFFIRGEVRSPTHKPIPGIKVSVKDVPSYDFTNSDGVFHVYGVRQESYEIKFEDVDGPANGSFKTLEKKISHDDTRSQLFFYLEEETGE